MNYPSRPTGYDVAYHVSRGRSDCHLTVGFDREQGHVPRFLVTLHYRASTDPVVWGAIARIDHNETSIQGHDVYREGLHVDVARHASRPVHLQIRHASLPSNPGVVVRGCVEYLIRDADYFIDVYEERRPPGSPPRWSADGGESTRMFISADLVEEDMSREAPAEDEVLTPEELSEVLADATDTDHEEIERGAAELEIAPPEEADIVAYGEHDGEHGFLPEPDDE
jgi:hypothetical protein